MKRREFITLVGGGAVAWPLAARAQQPERRIGVLMSASEADPEYQGYVAAFREQLQKFGWIEGRNLRIDYRWRALDPESRQRFAMECVALQPDLILAQSTPTTASLLAQTRTIPVIFASAGDPVGDGFVTSLSRPGGNATGFINMESSIAGKWLELLKEVAPHVRRVAFLFNPTTAPGGGSYYLGPFKAAAVSFALETIAAPLRDTSGLEAIISAQAREPDSGLVMMSDAFLLIHRAQVASLAARYRLPAVYPYRQFAEVGGLLSYGNDLLDNYRRAGAYADRLEVPPMLLARADEVIE
jgi:putative ABC transport system substrate-binding protein